MQKIVKATRVKIHLGDIPLNVYQLPDGSYRLAGRNVTDAIEEHSASLTRVLGVKSLNDVIEAESARDSDGYSIVLLPVKTAIDYWSFMAANKGSEKSYQLLSAISSNPELLGLNPDFTIALSIPASIAKESAKLKSANIRRILKNSPEKQVENALAKNIPGAQTQVLTKVGQIDILSPSEVIEVKSAKSWKSALGQVLVYGRQYPSHSLRIHLFGSVRTDMKQLIESECTAFGVRVTWE